MDCNTIKESPKAEVLMDIATAVLHTIVYHRSLGIPNPREHMCSHISCFYVRLDSASMWKMRCGEPTNEQQIDQRTKEVLEMLYL